MAKKVKNSRVNPTLLRDLQKVIYQDLSTALNEWAIETGEGLSALVLDVTKWQKIYDALPADHALREAVADAIARAADRQNKKIHVTLFLEA